MYFHQFPSVNSIYFFRLQYTVFSVAVNSKWLSVFFHGNVVKSRLHFSKGIVGDLSKCLLLQRNFPSSYLEGYVTERLSLWELWVDTCSQCLNIGKTRKSLCVLSLAYYVWNQKGWCWCILFQWMLEVHSRTQCLFSLHQCFPNLWFGPVLLGYVQKNNLKHKEMNRRLKKMKAVVIIFVSYEKWKVSFCWIDASGVLLLVLLPFFQKHSAQKSTWVFWFRFDYTLKCNISTQT